MAGGNRAFTVQDVLAQLNTDSGATNPTQNIEVNLFVVAQETLGFNDVATAATGGLSFNWDNNQKWGTLPWQ